VRLKSCYINNTIIKIIKKPSTSFRTNPTLPLQSPPFGKEKPVSVETGFLIN
jgi:hypothetical protein